MSNKATSVMLAAIMLTSCFAAFAFVPMDDSDAAQQGDAWGYTVIVDGDGIIEMIYNTTYDPSIKSLLTGDDGNVITMDGLEKRITDLGPMMGIQVDKLNFDVKAEAHVLSQVKETGVDGTTVMNFAYAIAGTIDLDLKVTGSFSDDLDDLEDFLPDFPSLDAAMDDDDDDDWNFPGISKQTIEISGMKASFSMVSDSTIAVSTYGVTMVDSVFETSLAFKGAANIDVNGDDFTYTPDVQSVDEYAIVSSSYNMKFDSPISLTPSNGDTWGGKTYAHILMESSASTSFDDDDNGYVHESEFDDVDYDGMVLIRGTEENGMPTLYLLTVEDLAFIYTDMSTGSSIDNAGEIRASIDKLLKKSDNAVIDRDMTVNFYDEDDNLLPALTQTVKYGTVLELPDYPADAIRDDDDGEFIGWESNDRVFADTIVVYSNLHLEPEFAEIYENQKPSKPSNSGSILWEVQEDMEDLFDEIDKTLVNNGNTLYIEVKDANGQVLYSWKMSNNMGNITTSKLIPNITETEVPEGKGYIDTEGKESMYLDFSASGTMPSDTVVSYSAGGKFANGTEVTILYDTGTSLDYVATSSVVDGYFDIPLTHCSSYVVLGEGDSGSSGNTMMYIAIAIVAILVIAVAIVVVKKRGSANA